MTGKLKGGLIALAGVAAIALGAFQYSAIKGMESFHRVKILLSAAVLSDNPDEFRKLLPVAMEGEFNPEHPVLQEVLIGYAKSLRRHQRLAEAKEVETHLAFVRAHPGFGVNYSW